MKLKFMIVALALLGLSPALYGQSFPTKPIELVVSSSPGGGIDLIFRLLAEELAKTLKTQVNVVNQTAGAGAIAAEKVAGARKDGYTLLGTLLGQVATMSVANPKAPANLLRDFQPIAILHGYAAVIMLGRADSEIKTIKDRCDSSAEKTRRSDRRRGSGGDQPDVGSRAVEARGKDRHHLASLRRLGAGDHESVGWSCEFRHGIGRRRAAAYQSRQAHRPRRRRGIGGASRRADLRQAGISRKSICSPASPSWRRKDCPTPRQRFWRTRSEKQWKNQSSRKILKSRGYNVDLRTSAADINKLIKEEIDKYSRFTPEDLGWKAQ